MDKPAFSNIALTISIRAWFFLSAIPLDRGELGGALSWIIPCSKQNKLNSLEK
jgi:hypothetical protein